MGSRSGMTTGFGLRGNGIAARDTHKHALTEGALVVQNEAGKTMPYYAVPLWSQMKTGRKDQATGE